tara:strand:- start:8147 stop:8635 length:489 start_codon:yes stop_codon:yes gene_type:complete
MSVRSRKLKMYTSLIKEAEADQHGIFNSFQGASVQDNTRDKYLSEKHNTPLDRSTEGLYGITPEHEDSDLKDPAPVSPHLSTRYVPGYIGLQARRIGDGVVQNPLTGEVFDYQEGFKVGDEIYNPGDVSMQTSLIHFANYLDKIGLTKEANLVDSLVVKLKR